MRKNGSINQSRKHDPVCGWGTRAYCTNEIAESLIQTAVASNSSFSEGNENKVLYNYHEGKFYVFRYDNVGTYHYYPVDAREVPADVIRKLIKSERIPISKSRKLKKRKRLT